MKTRVLLKFTFIVVVVFLAQSCGQNSLSFLSGNQSDYEEYSGKLDRAGLNETSVGQSWQTTGSQSLVDALESDVPFAFSTLFRAKEVKAVAWKFNLSRGQSIKLSMDFNATDSSVVFADIFEESDLDNVAWFTSADGNYSFESKKSQTYILRIQPELFAEGNLTLRVEKAATYAVFPIYGKDASAVQSFWGAPRGGGTRKHEGIDIFAARGTPVLAPVDGTVSSVRNRGLGGKQVWLRDSERGFNLYFAHLDSQLVSFGQRLKAGDTLGLVGNTGNARFTPPHLHFGIYSGGAFDPFPMVDNRNQKAETSNLGVEDFVLNIKGAKANFRNKPSIKSDILNTLENGNPVKVIGAQDSWYRLQTPNRQEGYVHSSLVGPTKNEALEANDLWVWNNPFQNAGDSLLISGELAKFGEFEGFAMLTDDFENVYYTREEK